jgi:hypothetical protein
MEKAMNERESTYYFTYYFSRMPTARIITDGKDTIPSPNVKR